MSSFSSHSSVQMYFFSTFDLYGGKKGTYSYIKKINQNCVCFSVEHQKNIQFLKWDGGNCDVKEFEVEKMRFFLLLIPLLCDTSYPRQLESAPCPTHCKTGTTVPSCQDCPRSCRCNMLASPAHKWTQGSKVFIALINLAKTAQERYDFLLHPALKAIWSCLYLLKRQRV